MSQRSLAALPGQTPQPPSLHPALQSALSSLDVQLEDELARYRRSKAGDPLPPPRGLERYQPRKTLDLISLTPQPNPEIAAPAAVPFTPPEPVAPPEPLVENTSLVVVPSAESNPNTQLTEPPASEPDDYLESSEELLKNLADETETEREIEIPDRDRSWTDNLLTPLGVGAMLLLLLLSATLGFALKNPSVFSPLMAGRSPESTTPEATDPTTAALPSSPTAQVTALPQAPNLANREFKDINLDTLSTLKRSPSPSPASPSPSAVSPSPATVIPRNGVTSNPPATTQPPLASLLLPPTPVPQTADSPQLAPEAGAEPSEPVEAAPTPGDGLFYAVVDYDSDRTLEQVREVVPDAYLREFSQGTKIQLGTFTDQASAEAFIDELEYQGISAQIEGN